MTPKEEAAEPVAWRWKWEGTASWNLTFHRPHPKDKTDIEPLFAVPPQPSGEVERMREALQFYADTNTWRTSTVYACGHSGAPRGVRDGGSIARAALAAIGGRDE